MHCKYVDVSASLTVSRRKAKWSKGNSLGSCLKDGGSNPSFAKRDKDGMEREASLKLRSGRAGPLK